MPGHDLRSSQVKDSTLFKKYKCHHCNLLLKDAVQPLCGHWLCEPCGQELLATSSPKCPRPDCGESLQEDEEEVEFFPDNFVRREIKNLTLACRWINEGCNWEGKFKDYERHLADCSYSVRECTLCGKTVSSNHVCSKKSTRCPLADIGCTETSYSDLMEHITECGPEHLRLIVSAIKSVKSQNEGRHLLDSTKSLVQRVQRVVPDGREDTTSLDPGYASGRFQDNPTTKGRKPLAMNSGSTILPKGMKLQVVNADSPMIRMPDDDIGRDGIEQGLNFIAKKNVYGAMGTSPSSMIEPAYYYGDRSEMEDDVLSKVMSKVELNYKDDMKKKDNEIATLKSSLSKLEKLVKSKHAEFEDRDFRLSLIENSNYDGSMVWKIPQFSQRMSDAQSGKYTSIFSLPFYTSRYGYKMCLRLYILGDGIGKGSYMSLFFVVMRGEFDNILRWPFVHKVTFKLINQANNRDVVDTFQPDPMSSSFRKPKSDMNIASGCPRFVSHTDLKNNGFIVDDTVFIKCMVDTHDAHHP